MRKADQIILGEGVAFSSDSEVTGLNNNILGIGTSGCGKTTSIIEPTIIETYIRSLVVTVTKRRLVYKYDPVMRMRGYNTWDLNFVNPKEGNSGHDPLQYIKSHSDASFLARSIVLANPRKERSNSDPYWDDGAISLLTAEIGVVMHYNSNPTFADVLDFHSKLTIKDGGGVIHTNYDTLFIELALEESDRFYYNCWKSFQQLPIRTASCIFSALNTTLDTIFTSELKDMFRMGKKVDFEKLASEKTVLFVTTSPVNAALNNFISSFYATMFKSLFEFAEEQPDGKLPIPVHVICDDFATGCPVVDFEQHVSIFREKGLSVTIMIQSESQLSAMYGSCNATTIINNMDTIVFLGSMDLQTGRDISIRANRPLEDILYMPIGSEIIFRRGMKPIFTKRFNTYEHPAYKKITQSYEKKIARQKKRKNCCVSKLVI